eukprot:4642576-Pleurochrysis_carterae.AAC.1
MTAVASALAWTTLRSGRAHWVASFDACPTQQAGVAAAAVAAAATAASFVRACARFSIDVSCSTCAKRDEEYNVCRGRDQCVCA